MWVLYPIAVLVTYLLFAPFACFELDIYHDAFMLKPAMDVASGQRLFRDTYTLYGPIATYINAIVLKIVGITLVNLKLWTMAIYALYAGLLLHIWKRLFGWPLACLSLAVWWLTAPFYFAHGNWGGYNLTWATAYAVLFQSCAITLTLSLGSKRSWQYFPFTIGILVALLLLTRQPWAVVSLPIYMGTVAILAHQQKKSYWQPATTIFAGFFIGVLSFALVHFGLGSCYQWIDQNFVLLTRWGKVYGGETHGFWGHFSNLFPFVYIGKKNLIVFFLALCPLYFVTRKPLDKKKPLLATSLVCLFAVSLFTSPEPFDVRTFAYHIVRLLIPGLALYWLIKNRKQLLKKPKDFPIFFVCVITTTCFIEIIHHTDEQHRFWAVTFAWGPLVWLVFQLCNRKTAVTALVVLAVFSGELKRTLVRGWARATRHERVPGADLVKLEAPSRAAGMWVPAKEAPVWAELEKVIGKKRDIPFLTLGDRPFFTTLTDNTENPSPYWVWSQYFIEEDWLKRVNRFLEEKRPVVFLFPKCIPGLDLKKLPALNNYHPLTGFSNFQLVEFQIWIPFPQTEYALLD